MMKKFFTLLLISVQFLRVQAQNIGIGTTSPNASAALDISHTAKGLLIPRMTSAGVTAILNPAKGLMVYDSVKNQLMTNIGTASIPNWQNIVFSSGWGLSGNSGTNPSAQFIGNTDNQSLQFRVNNIVAGELNPGGNVFWGLRAGLADTTNHTNIAIGMDALKLNKGGLYLLAIGDSALYNNGQSGNTGASRATENTAIGYKAMFSNLRGSNNTAVGFTALMSNTGGVGNSAFGNAALNNNVASDDNTATGAYSLFGSTSGEDNTGNGAYTLYSNITGNSNTATGSESLFTNTASNNTANGYRSLYFNSAGSNNTALGFQSQYQNTTGINNVSNGYESLLNNTSGIYNTAIGTLSMLNNNGAASSFNTAVGGFTLYRTTNSQYNTVVGYNAGSIYDLGYNNTIIGANCDAAFAGAYNDIAIGQAVTCTDNSQARIGNAATVSIGGYANWTNISDGRYKKNLKENVQGLAFIMKLRPVTYNLDIMGLSQKLNESRGKPMDPQMRTAIAEKEQVIQTGFVAQEVEQAAKETSYEFSGVDKPRTGAGLYGLRYSEFVVPLVKAMQEQQQMIELLKQQNELLIKRVEKLEKKN